MTLLTLNLNVDQQLSTIPESKLIMTWLEVAYLESTPCTVNIEIVTEELAQSLNKQYRGKDYATNVLSFPFEAPPIDMPMAHLGDLVLCANVVKKEAAEQTIPIDNHWAHLFIHGMLHLQGYDHINDSEAEAMELLEIKLLKQLNINNPYLI